MTGEDLELTPEQHMLFYKLEKTKNEFHSTTRQRQEQAAKRFPPIMGFDIMNVSPMIKTIYFVTVFALFSFGILYGLKKLEKKKVNRDKKQK